MTTQNLYQKTLNEEMSPSQFLWHVRRDPQYSSIITNTMSFEDTINCLKTKGFIWEAKDQSSNIKPMDFLGSFKKLTEAATKKQKLKGGKGDKLTPDQVNYFEFTKGWKHELEHTDDIDKAKEIALDHLAEDPMYYTRLQMVQFEKSKKERSDLPIDISKKKASVKDEKNQMTPIKKAKKEKPNVSDSGKQEKARSKNAGFKKMKGGSGEMKSLKESLSEQSDEDDLFGDIDVSKYKNVIDKSKEQKKSKDPAPPTTTRGKDIETASAAKPKDKKADKPSISSTSSTPKEKKDLASLKGNFALTTLDNRSTNVLADAVRYKNLVNLLKNEDDPTNKYKRYLSITPLDKNAEKIVKGYEKVREKEKQERIKAGEVQAAIRRGEKPVQKTKQAPKVDANKIKKEKPTTYEGDPYEVDFYSDGKVIKNKNNTIGSKILSKIIGVPEEAIEVGKTYSVKKNIKSDNFKNYYVYSGGDIEVKVVKKINKTVSPQKVKREEDKKAIEKIKTAIEDIDNNLHYFYNKNTKDLASFSDLSYGQEFARNNSGYEYLGLGTTAASRLKKEISGLISEEKQQSKINGIEVVFNIQDPENLSAIEQVRNTISGAKFNKDKKELTLNMSGKGDLVFTADASGKPVGVYFSQGKQSGVSNKVVDSAIKDSLDKILKKYYPKPQDLEKSVDKDKILEDYIRKIIRKTLKEGDEGPFIGSSGPEVVKKKLIDYMQRYSPDWNTDPSPKQRAVGAEYQGIIAKLVAELNDQEPGLGTSIYKQYTGKVLRGDQADQATPPPQTLAYDPAKLVSRGGRIAENDSLPSEDEIVRDAKRYNDPKSQEFKNALKNLQALIQDYGEKGKDLPKKVLDALRQMSDINK